MKDALAIGSSIVLSIAFAVGSVWGWRQYSSDMRAISRSTNHISQTPMTQQANTSDANSLSVSQDGSGTDIGAGQIDTASGSLQSQGFGTSTGANSSTSTTSTASSSNTATMDPAQFGMYERYKEDKTAVFAEVSQGSGAEAVNGKKVAMLYRGWLTNGTLFDQAQDSAKPFVFTLGAGSVISGWEQTIAGMKVGGERLLVIPPTAGYGATGQGTIPGNSVLVFDVKLIAVE